MILRNVLLPGVVLPAVSTALALVVLGSRRGTVRGAVGMALAAGFLTGFVAISGWPRWPPVEATQRLFFLVAALGVLSWPLARTRGRWPALAAEGLAAVLLVPLVLWAVVSHTWSPLESTLWLAGLILATLAFSRALGAGLERHANDPPTTFVRWVLLGTVAAVLGLSESFRLALLAGALGASVAVVDLAALRGAAGWRRTDTLVPATALSGLLLVGHFYAALDGWIALLLFVAGLLTALSDHRSDALRWSPLLPLLMALVLTLVTFFRTADDPYDYYSAAPNSSAPSLGWRSG